MQTTSSMNDRAKSEGPPDPDKMRLVYDEQAARYDQSRLKTAHQRRFDDTERRILRRHLPQLETVLEVGVGTGRLTNELLVKAARLTAVDISEEMLARVRQKYPNAKNLRLVQASAYHLDQILGYGSFDAVVSMRMLPHIEDMGRVLKLLRNAAKPGGLVILDFWNRHSYTYWRKKGSSVYNHYVTYGEALLVLQEADLELLALEGAAFQNPLQMDLEFLGRTALKRFAYSLVAACRRPTMEVDEVRG